MRDKKRVLHYSESILREKNGSPFSVSPFPSFGASNFPQKKLVEVGFAQWGPLYGWLPGICVVSPAEFWGDQVWKMLKNAGYLQRWKLVSMKHIPVTRQSFSSARCSAFKPVTSRVLTRGVRSNKSNMTSLVLFVSFPVDAIFVDS